MTLHIRAFAKINLGLKIRSRRPDGYHEILTVYQTIGLHDRLTVTLQKTDGFIAVHCDSPGIPTGQGNLVYKACELWRRATRERHRIDVILEKRVPVGAGLGGGSGDAAAALLGLERMTGSRLASAELHRIAAQLGSDVPLFLLGGRVLGCGRGEEIYPLWDLPAMPCLVAFPGFGVSTAEAYQEIDKRLRLTRLGEKRSIDSLGAWPHFSLSEWGPAESDFEQVVFARWPELARVKARLIQAGAKTACLTGSGSAVFAVFDSAPKLARALNLVPAGWEALTTRTLPRSEYSRAMWE